MARWLLGLAFVLCLAVGAVASWRLAQLVATPAVSSVAQADTQRGDDAGMAKRPLEAVDAYKSALSEDPHAYQAAQMLMGALASLPEEQKALVEERQGEPDNSPAWHLFLCLAFLDRARDESYYLTEASQEFATAREGLTEGSASPLFQETRQALLAAAEREGVSAVVAHDVRAALGPDPLLVFGAARLASLVCLVMVAAAAVVVRRRRAAPASSGPPQRPADATRAARPAEAGPLHALRGLRAHPEVIRRNLPNDPPPVKHIVEYKLQRIADGGLKIIYRGTNPVDKQTYAIAQLQPRYLSDTEVVEHFRQGVSTLLGIRSARIVATYEFRHEGGNYYSVMEYLNGESLDALLAQRGRLQWLEAFGIFRELCEALKVVHGQGIVHRDIKPANFQRKDGIFKLLDFDTVLITQASRLTRIRDGGVGTPAYMAPEQSDPSQPLGPPTNIYALCAVLCEMLTGSVPSEGKFAGHPAEALAEASLEVPPRVQAALVQGLATSPQSRFSSIDALLGAMGAA